MTTYRLRWTAHSPCYPGQWASEPHPDREWLETLRLASANAGNYEVVEVEG